MIESHQHVDSKHPKATYEECFPEEEEETTNAYEAPEEEAVPEETYVANNKWVCVFTGDTVCNDGYRQAKSHKFTVLSVNVPKSATGDGDIPAAMKLKKVEYADKKAFMGFVKGYLGRIVAQIKKDADKEEDDVKHFQA